MDKIATIWSYFGKEEAALTDIRSESPVKIRVHMNARLARVRGNMSFARQLVTDRGL